MFVSWFFCVILLWLIIAAAKVGECTNIVNKLPVNIFKMTRNKKLKAHRSLDCRRPRTNYKPSDDSSCASQTHSLSCCSSPLLSSCAPRWQQWVAERGSFGGARAPSSFCPLRHILHGIVARAELYSRHWGLAWEEQTHSRQNRNPTTYPLEFKTWNLNSHEDHKLKTLEFFN
jgi:hypothetical protein